MPVNRILVTLKSATDVQWHWYIHEIILVYVLIPLLGALNRYRQHSYNYKISMWEILAAVHLVSVQLNINESLIAHHCMYLYIQPGLVRLMWMLICSCGDPVLVVDYRWLAGFWISFLWYPLNVFTAFEVMSVLKYLRPFMFNHGCVFFFHVQGFLLFFLIL